MSKEKAINCIVRCDMPGLDTIDILLKEQRRFPPPSQYQLKTHIKSAAE